MWAGVVLLGENQSREGLKWVELGQEDFVLPSSLGMEVSGGVEQFQG